MFLQNITDHSTSLLKKSQLLPLLNRRSSWHSSHLQHQLTILSLLSDIHCFHQQCFPTSEKLHAVVFGMVIPLPFMSSSTEIPLALQDLFSLQNFTWYFFPMILLICNSLLLILIVLIFMYLTITFTQSSIFYLRTSMKTPLKKGKCSTLHILPTMSMGDLCLTVQ